jgi:hypothetical protein
MLAGVLRHEIQIIPIEGNHGRVPFSNCWFFELLPIVAHAERFAIIKFALSQSPGLCSGIDNITMLLLSGLMFSPDSVGS